MYKHTICHLCAYVESYNLQHVIRKVCNVCHRIYSRAYASAHMRYSTVYLSEAFAHVVLSNGVMARGKRPTRPITSWNPVVRTRMITGNVQNITRKSCLYKDSSESRRAPPPITCNIYLLLMSVCVSMYPSVYSHSLGLLNNV